MIKIINLLLLALFFISCSQKNEKITDLSQLKNKRICVLTGSAGDVIARKVFPNAKFLDMVASTDAAYNVKIGKADAFIFNKSVLLNITKKNPDLMILDKPVSQVEVAAALSKKNTELLREINDAIEQLKNDGTLKAMKEKWIDSEYQTVPEVSDIQNDNKNGILKMGTNAQTEPYIFLYNNKITGLDYELALRIGKILGKKIEITDMSFESLIPALQSGKIDFALADFNVTEERKNYINFSTPYIVNDISALVRK